MTWKNSVDRRIGSAWQSRLMRHERSQNVSSGHPPMGLRAGHRCVDDHLQVATAGDVAPRLVDLFDWRER